MRHYVWTRLAHETASINSKLPVRTLTQHHAAIALWLARSRRFYEAQTAHVPVTVVLTYDEPLAALVLACSYPRYVVLTTRPITTWLRENVPVGEPVTISRCDADDSYSTDWLEMLEREMSPRTERTHMLYYEHRQLNLTTGELSRPIRHKCPQFSTLYFPKFPEMTADEVRWHQPGNPLYGVVGNHGRFPEVPHIEAPGCYALLRVTGFNAVNCWGTVGRGRVRVEVEHEPDPRFLP